MLAQRMAMSQTSLSSSARHEPSLDAPEFSCARFHNVSKRWIVRVFAVLLGVCLSCGITRVAYAQPLEQPAWDVDLQARGVTPTSRFTASARFLVPGRHRFHRHHHPHAAPYQQAVPYQPYAPSPEGYVLEERANRALVWSGALLIGIPYAAGLSYSVLADFPGRTEYLAIPVVGPWLVRSRETDRATRVVLGLNGLTQATGAVLLTLGFTFTRKQWVPYQMGNVWVAPAASASGPVGVVAGGVF